MTNKEIASAFQLLAKLMELHKENPYKIRSYQKAYALIGKMGTPLSEMTDVQIRALPGVGDAISGKIGELLSDGRMNTLERYKDKTPIGIQELVMIKGLGPKKIKTAWEELGVESATELLYACTENRLVDLKGFGHKSQEDVRKQLEFFLQNRSKFIHLKARPIAERLLHDLKKAFPKMRSEFTGAIRRYQPVLCRVEFLLETEEWPDMESHLQGFRVVSRTDELLDGILEPSLPVRFYKTNQSHFAQEWLRTTGPKAFAEKMTSYSFDKEEDAFAAMKLPYVDPQARDLLTTDTNPPNRLITRSEIKGVIHAHSTYSDGVDSLADMASYAKDRGYSYLGITDHSQIAVYANGLKEEDLLRQWAEIEALNQDVPDFRVLKGIECDILSDGALDYSAEILSQFEFVIASIHTNIKMDKKKATERLIKAIESPYINILGHPTGRLLLGREGYPVDMQQVIDACSANLVAIELNASPYRLDLDWKWIPVALEKGVSISINPDAHAKEAIDYIDFGVIIANKGWLTPESCINALSVEHFLKFCHK